PHALEAARAGLQVRHANDVLVAHPRRQMPAHGGGDFGVAAHERLHALPIELGIALALIVAQPLVGEPHDLAELSGALRRRRLRRRLAAAARDLVTGGEAAQAGLGAAAALADRVLAAVARERQHA